MLNRRELLASVAALIASPAVTLQGTKEALTLSRTPLGQPFSMDGDTWYQLFVVVNDEGRPVDGMFVPTMENLDRFGFSTEVDGGDLQRLGPLRRMGSVLTDANGAIRPFKTMGDTFTFDEPIASTAA